MDRLLGFSTQLSNFHRELKELAAYTRLAVCVTCLLFLTHKFYFIARHASLVKNIICYVDFAFLKKEKTPWG